MTKTGAATKAFSRRDTLLGGAMALTAGLAWARAPGQRVVAMYGSVDAAVPVRVADWQAITDGDVVLPPQDERKAAALYEEQVQRTFVRDNSPPIMLVIAYDRDQSGMLMVHRPESCYPGSGFTITADRAVDIRLDPGLVVQGRFLSTERDERIEQVLYWTRLGDEFPATWDEERSFLAFQNLRGLAPDGALVRLSVIDADPAASYLLLSRFASALYAASGRKGRALFGGPASVAAEKA